MKRSAYVVAVNGGSLVGQYATRHVSGYSTWDVRVAIDDEGAHVTSVRLRGANISAPSAKALQNYATLHEEGLI